MIYTLSSFYSYVLDLDISLKTFWDLALTSIPKW